MGRHQGADHACRARGAARQEKDTKTRAHRTVRLLAPLREDLLQWRLRSGKPADSALVSPDRKVGCGRRRPMTTACLQRFCRG